MRLFFDLKLKSVGRVIEVRVGLDWGPLLAQGGRKENWVLQVDCGDSPLQA